MGEGVIFFYKECKSKENFLGGGGGGWGWVLGAGVSDFFYKGSKLKKKWGGGGRLTDRRTGPNQFIPL